MLYVNEQEELFSQYAEPDWALSDEIFGVFKGLASYPQAMIGLSRVLLNRFWWKRGLPDWDPPQHMPLRSFLRDMACSRAWWQQVNERTSEDETATREVEIATNLLLYLWCDPEGFLRDAQLYHYLAYLPLGAMLEQHSVSLRESGKEYAEAFSLGTLAPGHDGLTQLASQLGVSPHACIELLYPEKK